jgi:hypothetical protein
VPRACEADRLLDGVIRPGLREVPNPDVLFEGRVKLGETLQNRSYVRVIICRGMSPQISTVDENAAIMELEETEEYFRQSRFTCGAVPVGSELVQKETKKGVHSATDRSRCNPRSRVSPRLPKRS